MPHLVYHSLPDRHSSSFHLLTLMSNAAINSYGQDFVGHILSFLFGIYLEVELLNHFV